MTRFAFRLNTTEISLSASAIILAIAVQDFPPEPSPRSAHSIVEAGNRGEGADDNQGILLGTPLADQAEAALLRVGAVDPLESRRIEIQFMEGRFAPIEWI